MYKSVEQLNNDYLQGTNGIQKGKKDAYFRVIMGKEQKWDDCLWGNNGIRTEMGRLFVG